ncbi:hypothetical protein LCGC14_1092970 [marine sediment metagenome]|uniref:Uncharacterized protein n=1 Tax=marine sediment metagenome TaxID=412755 RepID=A0A0F9MG58_9ZZZZ
MKIALITLASLMGIGGFILMGTLGNGWDSAYAVFLMLWANNIAKDAWKK